MSEKTGRPYRSFLLLLALSVACLVVLVAIRQNRGTATDRSPADPHEPTGESAIELATVDPQTEARKTNPKSHAPTSVASGFTKLHGVVLDAAGSPIAQAQVYSLPRDAYLVSADEIAVHCSPTFSDAQGTFELWGQVDASRVLVCRKKGFRSRCLALPPDDLDRSIRIVLGRGGRFHGRVLDSLGQPIEGATVRARGPSIHLLADYESGFASEDGLGLGVSTSDKLGAYEIGGLDPEGSYVLESYATGYAMVETRFADPRLWKAPTEEAVDITMTALAVAVVGVRASGVDYTRCAGYPLMAQTNRHVTFPPGLELAYGAVPLDRFEYGVSTRVRELMQEFLLIFAKEKPGESRPRDAKRFGTVALPLLTAPSKRFRVEFRLLGREGWDSPQWLEFEDTSFERLGTVTVVAGDQRHDHGRGLFLLSKKRYLGGTAAVFRLKPDDEPGIFVTQVYPGDYYLTRDGLGDKPLEVSVAPEQSIRVQAEFESPAFLIVRPRYESGARANEVGIALAVPGGGERLHTVLEPYGCVEGPELIPITPHLRREVRVHVKKRGFRSVSATLILGPRDQTFEPILSLK